MRVINKYSAVLLSQINQYHNQIWMDWVNSAFIVYIMYRKLFILVLAAWSFSMLTNSQCCLTWSEGQCVSCPTGMHLYRYNCIFDLSNCIEYRDGFDCQKCKPSFRLMEGRCLHPRYNIDIKTVGNFTPFLHGAVQPDPLLIEAREELSNRAPWVDWYNYTALRNHTFLSPSALNKQAEQLQQLILNTTGTKLHFICKTTYQTSDAELTIYRLTYQLTNNTGYADLFFAVEPDGNEAAYVEIDGLRFSQLQGSGWKQLAHQAEKAVGEMLGRYFFGLLGEDILKGYWRESEGAYNLTLFYLDRNEGIVPYTYVAYQQDLDSMNITTLTDQTPSSSSNDGISINISEDNLTDAGGLTNGSQNSAYRNASGNSSENQTQIQPNPPFVPYNDTAKTGSSSSAPVSPPPQPAQVAANQSQGEQWVPVSELSTDLVFATGYAVAIQQGYVSGGASVSGLSIYPNGSRCLYFSSVIGEFPFAKVIFNLDQSSSQFSIVSFQESATNMIPGKELPSANATTADTNISSNSSSKNSSNVTITNSSTPSNKNTTANKSSSSPGDVPAVSLPSNSSACSALNQRVDVTGQIQSDLFLPRINLLLTSMYSSELTNCAIGSASYEWLLGDSALVQTIRYYITYSCTSGLSYSFVAQISNNQLKLLTVPNGLQEEGMAPSTQNINITANATAGGSGATGTDSSSPVKVNSTNATSGSANYSVDGNKTPAVNTTNSPSNNEKSNAVVSPQKEVTSNTSASSAPVGPKIVIIDNTNSIGNQTQPGKVQTETTQQDSSRPSANTSSSGVAPSQGSSSSSKSPVDSKSQQNGSELNGSSSAVPVVHKTVIGASQFKSNPKYKSIIQIVKSIKRVPSNATVEEMLTWQDDKQYQYFLLTFIMAFNKTLPEGYTHKQFYYEVEVNPSSFITVTQESTQLDIKNITPSPPTNSSSPSAPQTSSSTSTSASSSSSSPSTSSLSSPSTSSPSLPSSTSSSSASPFLPSNFLLSNLLSSPPPSASSQAGNVLRSHNPLLLSFTQAVLSSSTLSIDFNGLRSAFRELIRFNSSQGYYCYNVNYNLIATGEGGTEVDLKGYKLTNCTVEQSNIFMKDLVEVSFKGASANLKVDKVIKLITKGEQIEVQKYEAAGQIYNVAFTWSGRNGQVVIDSATSLVLFYQIAPDVIFTLNHSSLTSPQLQLLNSEIQRYLRKVPFQIFYVEQTDCGKDSQNDILLEAYVLTNSKMQWGIEMEEYHALQLTAGKMGVKLVGDRKIEGERGDTIIINYYGLEKYQKIGWDKLLGAPEFPSIMASLEHTYPSFLQNCNVLTVLVVSQFDWTCFFNRNYAQEIGLKIVLSKQYSQTFFADYVITVGFTPQTMQVQVRAVEALPNTAILLPHCLKKSDQGTPFCQTCQQGYSLGDGRCSAEIVDCAQSFLGFCLKCSEGVPLQEMKGCSSKEETNERQMRVFNYFELGSRGN